MESSYSPYGESYFQQCLPRWVAAVEGDGGLEGRTVSIVRVQSSRTDKKTGEESVEDRYYITSLKGRKRIASSIRDHWGVESMHWTLDVNFGEDLSAKRARNAAFNFNILCKLALNILKNDGYD